MSGYDPGPPSEGHLWHITFDNRGSYRVKGDPNYYESPEFHGDPMGVMVRAWNIRDAFRKAADLPFGVLMADLVTQEESAENQ